MILDLLNKRCSVRSFVDKSISEEVIDRILEAGRLSPSGGNEQPWKFGVITNKELINHISDIAYHQHWMKEAPLLIVLCTMIVEDERGGREIQKRRFPSFAGEIDHLGKELYSNLNMEEHQTKIAGTQMVLAALENDVYSTWISYFDVYKLKELLRLPENCIPSEMIAFGYTNNSIHGRMKKSVEEITFYNYYE
ncbi:MAG: nitroreductase [Herbinix sp.]|jgi:nitroreductase|nr:nitroreductase [Herbinix sp.]